MEIHIQLQQQQKLQLTQQMRQAIQLLQLSNVELEQALEEEMLDNPSLELKQDDDRPLNDEELQRLESSRQLEKENLENNNQSEFDDQLWERLLTMIDSNADGANQSETFHQIRGGTIFQDLPPIEQNLSASSTLTDHLLEQLQLELCTDIERLIAAFMIGNLDHRGYLDMTYEEILDFEDFSELNLDYDDIESAALVLRELEPIACGARNLKECLLFQIQILYPEDPFFPDFVDYLPELEIKNYKLIAEELDMDIEDVEEYHKMICQMNPMPGSLYTSEEVYNPTVKADVKIVKIEGEWQIVSEDKGDVRLHISNKYRKMLQEIRQKKQTLEKMRQRGTLTAQELKKQLKKEQELEQFIENKLKSAAFLIQSIYKREKSIHRVMEAILMRQIGYFEFGVEELRPMILKDIAEDVELSESTISRISNNKYVETPFGLLEIKYFFTSGIPCSRRGEVSSESVKYRIRKIIDTENKIKPLSDNKILKILEDDGLQIARRTVSKYRESLGILSTRQRKILKRA